MNLRLDLLLRLLFLICWLCGCLLVILLYCCLIAVMFGERCLIVLDTSFFVVLCLLFVVLFMVKLLVVITGVCGWLDRLWVAGWCLLLRLFLCRLMF